MRSEFCSTFRPSISHFSVRIRARQRSALPSTGAGSSRRTPVTRTARGSGAVAAGVFLIYDRDTSQLFYDPSAGNATGRVQVLSTTARLLNTDFVVF